MSAVLFRCLLRILGGFAVHSEKRVNNLFVIVCEGSVLVHSCRDHRASTLRRSTSVRDYYEHCAQAAQLSHVVHTPSYYKSGPTMLN